MVAHHRPRPCDLRPEACQAVLARRAAIALEEDQLVAVPLAHQADHRQQALPEGAVEQLPVTACAGGLRQEPFDLAGDEHRRAGSGKEE